MPPDLATTPISVFLLDDHEIVRMGVAELINSEPDMEVVGEASTGEATLAGIATLQPSVALLDLRLQEGNGIEVCRQIRALHSDVACLILTAFDDDLSIVEAAEAGAAGFVLKQVRSNEIVASIRKVAGGAMLLDPAMLRQIRRRIEGQESSQLDLLSDQERRVFMLIGDGLSNRQIAERLFVAEKTVKNYVTSILSKISLTRRTEVAAMAARINEQSRQRFS